MIQKRKYRFYKMEIFTQNSKTHTKKKQNLQAQIQYNTAQHSNHDIDSGMMIEEKQIPMCEKLV